MVEFLENIKTQGETFICMLWGTVYADASLYVKESKLLSGTYGVSGSPNERFCYIGLTDKSLYVVAVAPLDTTAIVGSFKFSFDELTRLIIRKGLLGTRTVEVAGNHNVKLTVKPISLGTDINDQKTRMVAFMAEIEKLKGSGGY